jgi:hypothetical protein
MAEHERVIIEQYKLAFVPEQVIVEQCELAFVPHRDRKISISWSTDGLIGRVFSTANFGRRSSGRRSAGIGASRIAKAQSGATPRARKRRSRWPR